MLVTTEVLQIPLTQKRRYADIRTSMISWYPYHAKGSCLPQSDGDEYQSKLADAMVMNSQLEEANGRLAYQMEDLKDR